MKKSLLALAVLGAFTGIASAQTSVTIYGVVDAGLTREDNGTSIINRLDSGNQSSSRLGFKGNEDLGGGLSAQFVLEQGFQLDDGTLSQKSAGAPSGLMFGRQAYLGLTGAFGQVRLGRQKTVMYDALVAVDPFGIANQGGADRLFSKNTGVSRSDNTIAYFTPNLSGFTGEVTYTLGEAAGNNQKSRQYGVSLNYSAGPLFATVDYLNQRNATDTDGAKSTLVGATYDFGIVKANAGFDVEKGVAGLDQRDYLLGGSIPFGASAVQLDYIRKNDRSNAGNAGAKQYALGYTYALSKRTNFYSSYTRTQQDSGAGYVGVKGQTDKVLNAGIRHTF